MECFGPHISAILQPYLCGKGWFLGNRSPKLSEEFIFFFSIAYGDHVRHATPRGTHMVEEWIAAGSTIQCCQLFSMGMASILLL
ncbi:uncharacterized protein LAJ45_07326 [Morchella importuna]|uniref:uncharacterized protein n=1 Tax=Morchella importuna TaxID=1174673 RepID=UPI001E8E6DEF|nr:uncharacterized protein LAJ45_07326 [Morchella importuna]KAH8148615.1 hypothetical protein LAJ45_07326 [Morchella importuna]